MKFLILSLFAAVACASATPHLLPLFKPVIPVYKPILPVFKPVVARPLLKPVPIFRPLSVPVIRPLPLFPLVPIY